MEQLNSKEDKDKTFMMDDLQRKLVEWMRKKLLNWLNKLLEYTKKKQIDRRRELSLWKRKEIVVDKNETTKLGTECITSVDVQAIVKRARKTNPSRFKSFPYAT